jgi:hypothetical protein
MPIPISIPIIHLELEPPFELPINGADIGSGGGAIGKVRGWLSLFSDRMNGFELEFECDDDADDALDAEELECCLPPSAGVFCGGELGGDGRLASAIVRSLPRSWLSPSCPVERFFFSFSVLPGLWLLLLLCPFRLPAANCASAYLSAANRLWASFVPTTNSSLSLSGASNSYVSVIVPPFVVALETVIFTTNTYRTATVSVRMVSPTDHREEERTAGHERASVFVKMSGSCRERADADAEDDEDEP